MVTQIVAYPSNDIAVEMCQPHVINVDESPKYNIEQIKQLTDYISSKIPFIQSFKTEKNMFKAHKI